jgi:hypothetical protein
MQQHMHNSCQPQDNTCCLITTLQETPTFYFRELGEIARIILIYAQTMSLTYIYQHRTAVTVAQQSRRNPLTFLSKHSTHRTKCLHYSSNVTQTTRLQANSQNIQRYALHPHRCCFIIVALPCRLDRLKELMTNRMAEALDEAE